VKHLGWKFIDHEAERTLERYNGWYPALIDTVALSFGVGFVGTLDSTFSTLSAKRVEDWNNGFAKLVHRHL
jgi:fluoride ion exporter CrcB/FEX